MSTISFRTASLYLRTDFANNGEFKNKMERNSSVSIVTKLRAGRAYLPECVERSLVPIMSRRALQSPPNGNVGSFPAGKEQPWRLGSPLASILCQS